MRDSLNFFWVGKMPDMDGLFAWQKHLKENGSEFNTRLWVDDGLFSRLLAGEGASSFESVRQINANELEVVRNGQTLVISNFDKILLEPARRDYPKCCTAYDSLKEKYPPNNPTYTRPYKNRIIERASKTLLLICIKNCVSRCIKRAKHFLTQFNLRACKAF